MGIGRFTVQEEWSGELFATRLKLGVMACDGRDSREKCGPLNFPKIQNDRRCLFPFVIALNLRETNPEESQGVEADGD